MVTELLQRAVLIGVGATLVMDGWTLVQRQLGIRTLDYAMLGRWIGHLPRGKFRHHRITDAPPVRFERLLGWSAHYGIGIGFAGLTVAIYGAEWTRQPTVLPALIVGVGTVVAPFFILQPALGAGIASSRTPNPTAARVRSLLTHTVYGLGLYLSASVWAAALAD